jgi:hypothetical protein
MMLMNRYTPRKVYGWLGYRVFNYLFDWSDRHWERRIRDRFFQFAPVYISSECMRWWLQRGKDLFYQTEIDCFVKKGCLLLDRESPWYDPTVMPPVSLYIGGRDKLVNGRKLIDRFENKEKIVPIRIQIDEDYEHLDCLWSMDCIERIGKRIREDIWETISDDDVVIPEGCNLEDKGRFIRREMPN